MWGMHWKVIQSYRKDIFYLLPKEQQISNMSLNEGTESFQFPEHILQEKNYKIYVDGKLVEKAEPGDTVVYRNEKIKLLK